MYRDGAENESRSLIPVAMIIIAFLAFFVIKVSGHFDFSHSYHIREISATMEPENVMALIDGDEHTVWGDAAFWTETMAEPGDSITITFDNNRPVLGVEMKGVVPDRIAFYAGESGDGAWQEIKVRTASDGRYLFEDGVNAGMLRIEVMDGCEDLRWHVTELMVIE